MSPIIDVQRRLAQTGRIRIGETVAGESADGKKYTRPKKLETFRFTSGNESAIIAVAKKYGGTPHIWEGAPTGKQWEVFTESSILDILLPPERMSFDQFYELWSGGGCQRRCNGAFQVPSEEDCVCDPNSRECKPHTRLSVMLDGLDGTGLWRLDTQGWNAANELSGAFELASLIIAARGMGILPGTLRLDQRETKRPNPKDPSKTVTRKFAVPVIDFAVDISAIARGTQVAIESRTGLIPIPDNEEPLSVAEELERINTPVERPKRSNSAEPVRPTGIAPRARGVVRENDDEFSEPPIGSRVDITPASPEMLEKLRTAFGMLEQEDRLTAATKFSELDYPPQMNTWTLVQVNNGLDIVTAIHGATTQGSEVEEGVDGEVANKSEATSATPAPGSQTADEILPPRASKDKIKKLNTYFSNAGFGDREVIHEYAAKVIGIPNVKSLNELTTEQVNQVIQALVAGGAQ